MFGNTYILYGVVILVVVVVVYIIYSSMNSNSKCPSGFTYVPNTTTYDNNGNVLNGKFDCLAPLPTLPTNDNFKTICNNNTVVFLTSKINTPVNLPSNTYTKFTDPGGRGYICIACGAPVI